MDHGACSQVGQYAPWCSSCSEVPHVTSANPAGRVRRRDGATVRIASAHSREAGRRGRPFVSTASPNSSRRCCHGSHRRGRCRSDPEREASGSSSLLPARIASPSPSTDVECGEGEQGLSLLRSRGTPAHQSPPGPSSNRSSLARSACKRYHSTTCWYKSVQQDPTSESGSGRAVKLHELPAWLHPWACDQRGGEGVRRGWVGRL